MKYYYLDEDEEVSEPTDLAKLEELHLQGAILATTKVCKEGGTEWIPLYQALKGMASGAGSDSRRSAIDIPKAVQVLAEKNEPKEPGTATRLGAEPESAKELSGITRTQGTLIIAFLGAFRHQRERKALCRQMTREMHVVNVPRYMRAMG
jgi:hypothetical protein